MITFLGESENYALFTDGTQAVVVDKDMNMVEDIGLLSDLSSFMPWRSSNASYDELHLELAKSALADLSITVVTAAAGRMYTIPKAAQDEAKKALEWRKTHKRGGTPVGLNTARILANGGQIGIKKVRHIAKYFPRHEVDKKAKGYKPGEDGFPSNGRIAWALWGGDAAWRWAKQIVERENNRKSVKASADLEEDASRGYASDINAFEIAKGRNEIGLSPEFAARVRLDGSGIDRLYMIDPEGLAYVWDDGFWDDLGHVDGDVSTYDRYLDDPTDLVEKHHILIDADSAMILSAHLQERPFSSVSVSDLDEEEAELVADAIDHIDWTIIDSTMIAAAEPPAADAGDGDYTPEERSQNARRQVRDRSGRFSTMGSRVVVDGDGSRVGNITSINPGNGTVSVRYDDGTVENVDARRTEAADTFSPTAIADLPPGRFDEPLDTSGILAQPRAPIDRPNAYVPNGLPALTSADLQQIISNFPAWVMSQRQQTLTPARESAPAPSSGTSTRSTSRTAGDNAPETQKSDYLEGLEERSGKTLYTEDAHDHPLLQDFFKKKENELWYSPITSAAETGESEAMGEALTPDTSDVEPMHLAIVSPDDPLAVMDLVSIVPATSKTTSPVTFKRQEGKWVKDIQILADLKSATPPPVVALDSEVYKDVLSQVDGAVTSSAYKKFNVDSRLLSLYLANVDPLVAVGEGGLDRNRGKAEKLRRYWLYGRGALKIRWNTPGDWTRCYRHLRKYMGPRAKGYCALRHKEATGVWPGSKYNIGKKNRRGIRGSAFDNYVVGEENHVLAFARIRAAFSAQGNSEALVSDGEAKNGAAFSIPLVIPEGVETGDGRIFNKDAITIRELPLPLLWQIKTSDGHDGSVVVGRIDSMERVENGIGNAYGVFDSGPYGREAERMIKEGFIRGVSADLDRFEASEEPESDKDAASKKDKIGGGKIKVDKARVMAVTIVPKPAFEECKIYINEDDESSVFENQEDVMEGTPDGVYVERVDDADADALVACGMIASSIPTVPPADWFTDPKLSGPTPLTVDDLGRVYGHIAAWHQDHIGMSYGTRPPKSRSKYAYFHTGVVRADDGKDYPVGQLTLAGGHASLEASAADAAKHYDDTGSAIADVHAGEDAYGIWVAGALRPSATPEQIRALRASAPSGDWRPIKGQLELVAVCQVNVPGFPIARARVASGQVYALVAAGAMTLAKMKSNPLAEMQARLENLEMIAGLKQNPAELAAKADELRRRVAEMKSEDAHELSAKIDALSARVRADEPYDSLAFISMRSRKRLAEEGKALPDGSYPIRDVEDLKAAIHSYGRATPTRRAIVRRHIMKRARGLGRADLIPEEWKSAGLVDDDAVEDVRSRVASAQAAITASVENASTKAPVFADLADISQNVREKLAKEGKALPDGSYPIRNAKDLKNAIKAYGRSNPADRAKVRKHITKRARALGRAELVPDEWKSASTIDGGDNPKA